MNLNASCCLIKADFEDYPFTEGLNRSSRDHFCKIGYTVKRSIPETILVRKVGEFKPICNTVYGEQQIKPGTLLNEITVSLCKSKAENRRALNS